MSFLPRPNGNTPMLIAALIIIVGMVCLTILAIVGATAPEVFGQVLTVMVIFLIGGSAVAGTAAAVLKVKDGEHKDEPKP